MSSVPNQSSDAGRMFALTILLCIGQIAQCGELKRVGWSSMSSNLKGAPFVVLPVMVKAIAPRKVEPCGNGREIDSIRLAELKSEDQARSWAESTASKLD